MNDLIKAALVALFFGLLCFLAYFTIFTGLSFELNECKADLNTCVDYYNNNCWGATIDGPIFLNETRGYYTTK